MGEIPFKRSGYDEATAEAIRLRASMGRVLNYLHRATTGEVDDFPGWTLACEAVCRGNPKRLNRKQIKPLRKRYRAIRRMLRPGIALRSDIHKVATFS